MDRSNIAVTQWMPVATVAAAISFVIAFVMGFSREQTITITALVAIIVFSGLLFRSFGKDKEKYGRSKY